MPDRDTFDLIASIDWTPIVVALITLSGVVFNTLVGLFVWSQLRTPSGKSIGKQVEDVNHTTRSNWHMIGAMRDEGRPPQLAAPPVAPEGEA